MNFRTLNDLLITTGPLKSENTIVISVAVTFFTKNFLELDLIQLWVFSASMCFVTFKVHENTQGGTILVHAQYASATH